MYELVIIGSGPAGIAAGIYSARKKIKALLVTREFGGQSIVSNEIRNWVGTKSVSGYDFAKMLEGHLRDYEDDVEIVSGERITSVSESSGGFEVATESGKRYGTKAVLLASGSHHRKLGIRGEKEFDAKGVFYCSTCDAPVMKGKVSAVVGGGNSALEAVADLLPYATHIYLLVRDKIKGDPITLEKIKNNEKVTILMGTEAKEIHGDSFVKKLVYFDKNDSAQHEVSVEGVFVAIGHEPNSGIVGGLVELNQYKEVVVDCETQRTSKDGIWAAGDITSVRYKQNNISAGDGTKAVLDIYAYLHREVN